MSKLNADFWEKRYQEKSTGWDTGSITTPIKTYIDQLTDKSLKILIPGCGFGHEAAYLIECGFQNVTVVDLAPTPLNHLRKRFPNHQSLTLLHDNFFNLTGTYDLILEQTFFCAIDVELRPNYAKKAYDLLNVNGKLAGVLFSKHFENPGPPFGGTPDEYTELFSGIFDIKTLAPCYNSIAPRSGSEVFIVLKKNTLIQN
jgi:SAM-dependent methyltransferase